MGSVEDKATELWQHLHDIFHQVREVSSCANGPHADLSFRELQVLEFLGEARIAKMRDVAERLHVAVNSMTTIIDGLETKGFVQRTRSDEDRRVVFVEPTEAGRELHRDSVAHHVLFCRVMLEALNPDEQEIHMLLMRKIARAAVNRPTPENSR